MREQLEAFLQGGRQQVRAVKRAQILLAADQGHKDRGIARIVSTSLSTILRCKRRFIEGGLEHALYDRRHPGRNRKLSGKEEALLSATACSKSPEDRARWTMQLLADRMVELTEHEKLSRETVRRRLRENELKPSGKNGCGVFQWSMPSLSSAWRTCWNSTPRKPTNGPRLSVSMKHRVSSLKRPGSRFLRSQAKLRISRCASTVASRQSHRPANAVRFRPLHARSRRCPLFRGRQNTRRSGQPEYTSASNALRDVST